MRTWSLGCPGSRLSLHPQIRLGVPGIVLFWFNCSCVCVCVRAHLFEFIRFIQIGDLSTGENVVDVLQKGLLHDLRVGEEKDGGLVLNSRLVVQLPNICKGTTSLVSGEAGEEA